MAQIFTQTLRQLVRLQREGFIVLPLALVALQWITDTVNKGRLLMSTPGVRQIPWLENSYAYLYLHFFTLIPVLALSFDRNVHYYRKWRYLAAPIVVVGSVFIAWDVFFTVKEVWGFNHRYLSGWYLFRLPVEEWLFFFSVPFACVFIYECLNFYIRKDVLASIEPLLTPALILLFWSVGLIFYERMYTATTFLLAGGFLLFHYLFLDDSYRSRFYLAYLVSWLPFIVVNGVLTGGYTREPIVIYNPEEYLGLRLTSIPLDDSVYSFLLLMSVITLYERNRKRKHAQRELD